MTALENVLVGMHTQAARERCSTRSSARRGHATKRSGRRAGPTSCSTSSGLGGRGDVVARNLPYGDQRRLEVARALGSDPTLLLLDEPTAGMNPRETVDMMTLINKLRTELGLSVLLIEHDMRVVMGISDRISVLDHGERIAEGTPEEIRANPRVIEAYLGKPRRMTRDRRRRAGTAGPPAEVLLELKDVHTYYGRIHALQGVSLEVRRGEIVTLIGANGAGKTTILKTISGLLHARAGQGALRGQGHHPATPPTTLVKAGIGHAPGGSPHLLAADGPREPPDGRLHPDPGRGPRGRRARLRAVPAAPRAGDASSAARSPAASSRCSPSAGR